ncbi:hypothetical protein Zmor_008116 [Zophobas morio]|uniref:Glutathione S-transferase 1 n=1 Tax=Zophobas morio TaxID=2755281 RepID=A0AA38IU23_9CUCU|nr:hypothetical protein Zmor_008116 [Zophobas morio]
MAPTLYMLDASPAVRAVLMTAKAINLQLNLRDIDFFQKEQLQPEFLQMNPQHTIPTLVDDDGFVVWESQAIMAYLVEKYAKNDDLYPHDPKKRAIVNQRMHFNTGVAFFHMRNIAKAILWYYESRVPEKERQGAVEAYGFLETFLDGNEWVAGDFVSIADYSLIATLSTLNTVVPIEYDEYPNVVAWMVRCESLPGYPANKKGLKAAKEVFKIRMSKH